MNMEKQVAYFRRLSNADVYAETLRSGGIALTRLEYEMEQDDIDRVLAAAQGYQLQAYSQEAVQHGYGADRALIARCPNLLAVSTPGSGYDAVNLADCTAAGVLVVNQAGLHATAVAQHALGMMLCLSKKIIQAHTAMHGDADWSRLDYGGHDIDGKVLGVAGFGAVGRRLAEICGGAFGMRVITHHPRMSDADIRACGAEPVAFDAMLGQADFVVAALPLTDQTRRLFGAREFALMKPGAYFVTVARGGIHDEAALAAALRRGEIAGAGLDVWEVEPPPADHPLLAFPNVLTTPHNAGMTAESRLRVSRGAAAQWLTIFEGKRPPRLLNPDVWPRYVDRYARIMGQPPEEHAEP
ncbi:MAG: 3-phosphoglycerate dehydrogenase [Alphaproteobacteria bacterium]|nr:3-phosphoglycerate dehydrogenase [Alphaproteobacteria bacterium]